MDWLPWALLALLVISNAWWAFRVCELKGDLSDVRAERHDLQRSYDRLRSRQIDAQRERRKIAVNN